MPSAFGPPQQTGDVRTAVKAWNLMGCRLDWAALPIVAELFGIDDVETLITQLVALRDHQNAEG